MDNFVSLLLILKTVFGFFMFEESGNPGTQEEVVNEQSAVQHVDSSPYAFVHIVGPMAATSVT